MGNLIVFVGPDGSGKSTLIERTRELLEKEGKKTYTVRLGIYNQRTPLLKIARTVAGNPKAFPAPVFIKQIVRFLDMWIRYIKTIPHRLSGKTILCDRYFYDLSFYSDGRFGKFLSKLAPKPDLAFYICVDVYELLKRKREYSEEQLKKHIERMESLLEEYNLYKIENYDIDRSVSFILDLVRSIEK